MAPVPHAPSGGTTHAVGSKRVWHVHDNEEEEVAPSFCATPLNPPTLPTTTTCHHHHHHHYNGDLPLATPRATCGNVTRCDPITVVDHSFFFPLPCTPPLRLCSTSIVSALAVGGEVLGHGRELVIRTKVMQSDKKIAWRFV